jgi:formylglycine-generating enzyme required for sulfatase activity
MIQWIAAGEEKKFRIALGIDLTMCWCPAGDFVMGSPDSEKGRYDDENQVKVTISKGFWIGKYVVTQAQWQAVMGENPSRFKGENLPVECVSWQDAQLFLEYLNKQIGGEDGREMALPTEAQWEYACRAGEKGPYSGGTIDEVAWYENNSDSRTHAVGTKKANAWGLHDMHGNVWEWCQDWFCDKLSGGFDPIGPYFGEYGVFRGGSSNEDDIGCRAAIRGMNDRYLTSEFLGFRVTRISVP